MTVTTRALCGALSIGALAFLGMVSCGKTDGIGDPCVPEDEYSPKFSGFAISEVGLEARSVQCASRLCLVNHFQGRVGCPLGQKAGEGGCVVPGSSDPVTVDVAPWDLDRSADATVYCSCRCDGPDPNARYCDCPSGFSCKHLRDDLGLGSAGLAGSYCIRNGTEYQPTDKGGPTCADSPDDPVCR
jgi:hypothetical protein